MNYSKPRWKPPISALLVCAAIATLISAKPAISGGRKACAKAITEYNEYFVAELKDQKENPTYTRYADERLVHRLNVGEKCRKRGKDSCESALLDLSALGHLNISMDSAIEEEVPDKLQERAHKLLNLDKLTKKLIHQASKKCK